MRGCISRVLLVLAAAIGLYAPKSLAGSTQFQLELGRRSVFQGQTADVPLELSADAAVQGLVAAFSWDDSFAEGVDLVPAETLAGADTIVRRVESSFMVLGVIIDSDGKGPDTIGPGDGMLVATARIRCLPGSYGESQETPLAFRDGEFSAAAGGPLLSNIVVASGESIGREEGLRLADGSLECVARIGIELRIPPAGNEPGDSCGTAEVRMDHPVDAVEGYSLAITHPPGLRLESISIAGTAIEELEAEFVQAEVFEEGGTLGVILDLVAPLEGIAIPPAKDTLIAKYTYCCLQPPAPGTAVSFDLAFVDGLLGDPPKDNVVVVGGVSATPGLAGGTFTCAALSEVCDDGEDNDGDSATDCDDDDCREVAACRRGMQAFAIGSRELGSDGLPARVRAVVGEETEVSLFYNSPEDFVPGGPQFDQVQGLSMVLCYPCSLQCRENSLDIRGTIVEAVGADFIQLQCDNDPTDGDGCELIFGILVDSRPPFDGRTLPPTSDFLRLASVRFGVAGDESLCGRDLPLEFCDGANGRGRVPISNLVAAENHSLRPDLFHGTVHVSSEPTFFRGDCDVNRRINVSDAAVTVLALFSRSANRFVPRCLDACDCNDDGRMDFADTVCILHYVFQAGTRPPAPGPGFDENGQRTPPGADPTPDELDCAAGAECAEAA